MNKNDKNNQDVEDYKATAGREQTPVEDGQPVTDEFGPMVIFIIIVISIAFLGMLGWGFMIVFGT